MTSSNYLSTMDCLNDNTIELVGMYTGVLHGPQAYLRLAMTCTRLRRLLLCPIDTAKPILAESHDAKRAKCASNSRITNQTIRAVIRSRVTYHIHESMRSNEPSNTGLVNTTDCITQYCKRIQTLEQLAIFERWITTTTFINDNRLVFSLASVNIEPSMHESVRQVIEIMRRHDGITLRLDSHCGIHTPPETEAYFGMSRAYSVWNYVSSRLKAEDGTSRVASLTNSTHPDAADANVCAFIHQRCTAISWGKKVSLFVSDLDDHPFEAMACLGRGWVEVSLVCDACGNRDGEALILPFRHPYYELFKIVPKVKTSNTEC